MNFIGLRLRERLVNPMTSDFIYSIYFKELSSCPKKSRVLDSELCNIMLSKNELHYTIDSFFTVYQPFVKYLKPKPILG